MHMPWVLRRGAPKLRRGAKSAASSPDDENEILTTLKKIL
jgi:hypothetical protein